tara:strand:- start:41 stop:238 length:198 start_codon:yes stop_codon:yes gene_type:complete
MENTTIKIKPFSNAEILAGNALGKLIGNEKIDPKTFKLINAVVWSVCDQLEKTPQLKAHDMKIND